MAVFRGFPGDDIVAVYNEPNTTGAIDDINAPRNAPALDPYVNLANLIWHINSFQYEIAFPPSTVTVNHPSITGTTFTFGIPSNPPFWTGGLQLNVYAASGATTTTLVTHNLGYVPLAFVVYDNKMLQPGTIVQSEGGDRYRWVSAYATSTIIGLRECRTTSSTTASSTLSAASRNYTVLVFSVPVVNAGLPLFGGVGDEIVLGRGKVNTANAYLRRTGAGDSPYSIDYSRTIDLRNGKVRTVTGGVTTSESGYNGSFTGGPFQSVGV